MMVRIRKLSARYVDLELGVGEGHRVRVVEQPGRWMPADRLEEMVGQLKQVVRAALGGRGLDYGILTGDPDRLDRAVLTVLYEGQERRPVAFNAMSLMTLRLHGREEDVLHLGLVVVDPRLRSRGLSWVLYGLSVMLLSFQRQLRPFWVSSVTQVPAIVGMVSESFTNVFPTADPEARRTHDHLVIARQIMKRHRSVFGVSDDAGFDPERFMITDAYTGGSDNLKKTFQETAKHRLEAYNRMCRDALDYDRGDDLLQIGQFALSDAQRYLLRSVPRGSMGSVLHHGVRIGLGSVLLPVMHWFTPGRAWGDLRPWREEGR